MSAFHYMRGGLATTTASLFLAISGEVLKWQFPAYASARLLFLVVRRKLFSVPLGFRLSQD